MENLQWEKTQTLGIQSNVIEPVLKALKATLESEKDQLVKRLNNLKRLGVIKLDTKEMNKRIQEMKF